MDVIAHGVMGSGIAKQIKEVYPMAFEQYKKKFIQDGFLELGDIQVVGAGNRIIINAMTQQNFEQGIRQVSYDAIVQCFEKMNDLGYDTIAMPMIGAGLGGGDWDIIETIINKTAKFNPVVFIYDK